MTSTTITRLPNETITHSASFLDAVSLVNLSATSKGMNVICSKPNLWAKVVFEDRSIEYRTAASALRRIQTIDCNRSLRHPGFHSDSVVISMPCEYHRDLCTPFDKQSSAIQAWYKEADEKAKTVFNIIKTALDCGTVESEAHETETASVSLPRNINFLDLPGNIRIIECFGYGPQTSIKVIVSVVTDPVSKSQRPSKLFDVIDQFDAKASRQITQKEVFEKLKAGKIPQSSKEKAQMPEESTN